MSKDTRMSPRLVGSWVKKDMFLLRRQLVKDSEKKRLILMAATLGRGNPYPAILLVVVGLTTCVVRPSSSPPLTPLTYKSMMITFSVLDLSSKVDWYFLPGECWNVDHHSTQRLKWWWLQWWCCSWRWRWWRLPLWEWSCMCVLGRDLLSWKINSLYYHRHFHHDHCRHSQFPMKTRHKRTIFHHRRSDPHQHSVFNLMVIENPT